MANDAVKTAEFGALSREHGADEEFKSLQRRLEKARGRLDELLKDQSDHAQVKLSLELLREVRKNAQKRKDYESFLRGSYYPDWKDRQSKHFDWACKVIAGEVNYFLSFNNF